MGFSRTGRLGKRDSGADVQNIRPYLHTGIYCRVHRTSNVSINNASWTPISWQAEALDPSNLWAVSPNPTRITVAVPGLYHCMASIYLQAANTNTKRARLLKNGAAYSLSQLEAKDTGSKDIVFPTEAPIWFDAGQYLELEVYQDSGGAINFIASTSGSWMALFRVA